MAAKKSGKSAKPSARNSAKRSAPKPAQRSAPKPAKKSPARAAKPASRGGETSGVVYSDVRRDALAWQLKKIR
jgi:hypothetical protein